MAKITLEDSGGEQVVIETDTTEHDRGVAPDGTVFRLVRQPLKLPGERWDADDGKTWWRRYASDSD